MFNGLAGSKVKLKQFLEDCKKDVFPSFKRSKPPFDFSPSSCCWREGGGLKVKIAKILMMEADARGVL